MKNVLAAVGVCLVSVLNVAAQWTAPATSSGTSPIHYDGNVGVGTGTATPAEKLTVNGNVGLAGYNWTVSVSGDTHWGFGLTNVGSTYYTDLRFFGVGDDARGFRVLNVNGGSVPFFVGGSGNVGIGTTTPVAKLDVQGDVSVTGNITMTGNINAKYQDVAEWVPASGNVPPGTVVVLNREKNNEVIPSTRPYDPAVAGVVSPNPGVILGSEGASKAMIATTGRVKVRVDASRHAIHVGDLLVTSDNPGLAMVSEPLYLGGVAIHRPGTLIGKALEPLPGGQGEILVLLSLQ